MASRRPAARPGTQRLLRRGGAVIGGAGWAARRRRLRSAAPPLGGGGAADGAAEPRPVHTREPLRVPCPRGSAALGRAPLPRSRDREPVGPRKGGVVSTASRIVRWPAATPPSPPAHAKP